MEKFWSLLLIIGLNVRQAVSCVPGTKRKEMTRHIKVEKRATFEWRHYNDYKVKTEVYTEWPEMDRKNPTESCRLHLSATFPKSDIIIKSSAVRNVFLFYKVMKNINNTDESNPVEVAALECELLNPKNRRRYVQFIRSPKNGYFYIVTRDGKITDMDFFITAEVRMKSAIVQPKKSHARCKHTKRAREHAKYNDTPEEQLAYEKEHHKDYHLHKGSYENWPELKNIEDKDGHCQKLLRRIFPLADLSKTYCTLGTTNLTYPKLQLSSEVDLEEVKVAEFVCHTPQQIGHNRLHFIRAPKPNCIYLSVPVNTTFACLHITKLFCKNNENEWRIEAGPHRFCN